MLNKSAKNNLMPNEHIIQAAKFAWAMFLPSILFFILSVSFLFDGTKGSDGEPIFAPFLVFSLILALPGLKYVLFNLLVITSVRVFGKTGIFKTEEMTSPLKHVQNVQIKRSFFGSLFGYGTVSITTASGVYLFKYIQNPKKFRNTLMAQIENAEYGKMDVHAEKIADAIYNKNHE